MDVTVRKHYAIRRRIVSQFAASAVLAGRSAIAVGIQPNDSPEYYLTEAESSAIAVEFSRVMDLEMTAEGKVVSTPIEQGSFASYNKVASPTGIRATLAVEGELGDLQSVVDRLFELKDGTELVNFVTPVREFQKYTLEKFSYQQAAEKGVNVLYVEINLSEIKEVEPQYTDAKAPAPITPKGAKNPANASTVDKGKQQVRESKAFIGNGRQKVVRQPAQG